MIQKGTLLKVIDNSSVYLVKCIGIFEGYKKRYASLSQLILVSVQKIRSKTKTLSKVKKGEIFKAVVVRLKKKNNVFLVFAYLSIFQQLLFLLHKKSL